MGRKGSKRRGRREDRATTVAESHPAKQMKLVPDGRNASKRAGSEGGGGNNLKAMPWTRWTGSELHNAKAEHLALADWKRDSFTSAAFEAYYRRQLSSHNPRGLLPEAEWPDFLAALRRPLPATFRLNPRHPAGAALLRRLRAGEFDLPAANGPQVDPPQPPPFGSQSTLLSSLLRAFLSSSPAVQHVPPLLSLCHPHHYFPFSTSLCSSLTCAYRPPPHTPCPMHATLHLLLLILSFFEPPPFLCRVGHCGRGAGGGCHCQDTS